MSVPRPPECDAQVTLQCIRDGLAAALVLACSLRHASPEEAHLDEEFGVYWRPGLPWLQLRITAVDITDGARWPAAIDPAGCGCTQCLTGEYVPLDQATGLQVYAMLRGQLECHLYQVPLAAVRLELPGLGEGARSEVERLLALDLNNLTGAHDG
jgi:hypothetical protein